MFAKLRCWLRARTAAPSGLSWPVELAGRMLDDLPPDQQRAMRDKIYYQYARKHGREPTPAYLFARYLQLDEMQQDTACRWINALAERQARDGRLLASLDEWHTARRAGQADWDAQHENFSAEDRRVILESVRQQSEAAIGLDSILLMFSRDRHALVQISRMLDDLAGTALLDEAK